jgi:hypothetical protein
LNDSYRFGHGRITLSVKIDKVIKINSGKILLIRLKIVAGKGAQSIVGLNFPCS